MTTDGNPGAQLKSHSLRGLVIALCVTTGVLIALIFTVLLVSAVSLRNQNSRAGRVSDLLIASSTVERSVVDLETGLRGYLITQDPSFLAPYNQARAHLPTRLASLRRLAEGDKEHRQVDSISGAINAYISNYAAPLIATHGRLSRQGVISATTRDRQLVNSLRSQFSTLNDTELALLSSRRSRSEAESNHAITAAAVGLGASVILLVTLAIYLVFRFLTPARTVANAAQQLAAGDLSARVPEVGLGEMATLARSFNAMAAELENRNRDLTLAHRQLAQALAEAREASAMKSNFLANMSHEIRTPLGGVIGMLDLLAETDLTAEQHEYVLVARSSGEALLGVVGDVLDIGRIEAGHLELERREFDVCELVEGTCEMFAASAREKGIELQSFVHDDVPAVVVGDRMRVGQILANLISNGVKFTPTGGVVVEVTSIALDEDKADLRFEVRDSGIGIEPERIAHLFESFTQADTGATRAYGGTGLGLTLARELTRMMGGTITADSQPGNGSKFGFVIPFEIARRSAPQPQDEQELRGLHVLVVDDDEANRRIFEAYASSWGMRPEVSAGAPSALAKLEQAAERGDPFDVALLDHHMPERSGLELARDIGDTPALRNTQLILMTSAGEAPGQDTSEAIGYVLSKPVRQSRLLDAIGTVMAGRVWQCEREPVGIDGEVRERQFGDAQLIGDTDGGVDDGRTDDADGRAQPPAHAVTHSSKILVAEDQSVNWMMVERLLANRGYSVTNAVNGREVLEMLEREDYDLVLMDCQMPVLDGYAATREVRRREAASGGRHTPIVAMTANAMKGDRELCLAAGMDDYLAKPITGAAIDHVLARWLAAEAPTQALDPDRMQELRVLFPGDESSELFEQLRSEVDGQLERIAAALGSQDVAEAREAAHRILSSARMIGASGLVEAASALQACPEGNVSRAREVEDHLRETWSGVLPALEAELLLK
jgi:two-component system sensor histidine kinase/response regulator